MELFQVEVPGLPGEFPPPRTLDEADELPADGEPPYLGLAQYEEADAGRFFGREALVRSLVERLEGDLFLAVVGASGSGKSSLVRAGLMPSHGRRCPGQCRASDSEVVPGVLRVPGRGTTVCPSNPPRPTRRTAWTQGRPAMNDKVETTSAGIEDEDTEGHMPFKRVHEPAPDEPGAEDAEGHMPFKRVTEPAPTSRAPRTPTATPGTWSTSPTPRATSSRPARTPPRRTAPSATDPAHPLRDAAGDPGGVAMFATCRARIRDLSLDTLPLAGARQGADVRDDGRGTGTACATLPTVILTGSLA